MANKVSVLRKWLAPSVPFTVVLQDNSGRFEHNFKLAFDFNALALIEAHLGVNLLAQFSGIFNISATSVSIFFWAAAQAYQPEYAGDEGLECLRSYFTIGNFEAAAVAIQDAFKLSLNEDQRALVEEAIAKAKAEAAKRAALEAAGKPTPEPEGGENPLSETAEAK